MDFNSSWIFNPRTLWIWLVDGRGPISASPLASDFSRSHPRGADLQHQKRLGGAIGANQRPSFGIEEFEVINSLLDVVMSHSKMSWSEHLELTRSQEAKELTHSSMVGDSSSAPSPLCSPGESESSDPDAPRHATGVQEWQQGIGKWNFKNLVHCNRS